MASDTSDQIKKYSNLLRTSPTAMTPNVEPSAADLANQRQLLRLQQKRDIAESEALKTRWYGETQTGKTREGYLPRVLKALGTPLYATVGAVEAALGKGTKKGLFENVLANIEEEGTYGDLLRKYNLPYSVSMPLGFALDIASDPISWLTLGSSAMVPRVAAGAFAGAKTGVGLLKGAEIGARSGALKLAESAGRVVPGLEKRAFEGLKNDWLPKTYRTISEKAVGAEGEYRRLRGWKTVEEEIAEKASKPGWLDQLESKINEQPWGPAALKFFTYRPKENIRLSRLEELNRKKQLSLEETDMDRILDTNHNWDDWDGTVMPEKVIKNNVEKGALKSFETGREEFKQSPEILNDLRREKEATVAHNRAINKSLENFKNSLSARNTPSDVRAMERLAGMTDSELKEFSESLLYYRGDLPAYDRAVGKILMNTKARKILKSYAQAMGIFKTAKVPLNVGAYTNAIGGNFTMPIMYGLDVTASRFLGSLVESARVMFGKGADVITPFLRNREIEQVWRETPELFRSVFGIDPNLLAGNYESFTKMFNSVKASLLKAGKQVEGEEDVIRIFQEAFGGKNKELAEKALKGLPKMQDDIIKGSKSLVDSMAQGQASTLFSSDMIAGPFFDFVNRLKTEADASGKIYLKTLAWALTQPMENYNKVDQTFRLATFMHLTRNGITQRELESMARNIKLTADDIVRKGGRNVYTIKPEKAMEVVADVFMNYLAMPGFVQIMRSLPIFGAPFFSFAYGMSNKAATTLGRNPSFFNKAQFLLKEISGEQSPLEKDLLSKPYYEWYDREGMVKLPFFDENPVYLNLANMMPHYTLNFFQPVERTYTERFGSAVGAMIDKLPFMKDPAGQVMFDYVIQPLILRESAPKGTFDQALWPIDAKLWEKAAYTARGALETFAPPSLGYAGLLYPTGESATGRLGQAALPFMPSFRLRQTAYAKQGKTSVGTLTKEDPGIKTMRTLGALSGWPLYQMKLNYSK